MAERKKYYWLKLKRDFFKRHDVQIIEGMENGKDYVLFYLKLLVESIDHEGELRFSDTIPYDDNMLSTITNTNIDTVRCAMKIFYDFGLIELLDDETLFMNKITEMIGSETKWAEKKRLYRKEQDKIETSEGQKKTLSDKSIETELDKDKEIESKKPTTTKKFIAPNEDEVTAYLKERSITSFTASKFIDYYQSKGWLIGKNKMKDWKAAVRTWQSNTKESSVQDYSPTPHVNRFVK